MEAVARLRRVVGYGEGCREIFDLTRSLRFGVETYGIRRKVFPGNEHRREELLFEAHPIDLGLDFLAAMSFGCTELFYLLRAGIPVGEGGVHVLILVPLFILERGGPPVEVEEGKVGGVLLHADEVDVEIDHVVVRPQRIDILYGRSRLGIHRQFQVQALCKASFGQGRFGHLRFGEDIVFRIELGEVVGAFDEEFHVELRRTLLVYHQRLPVVTFVILELYVGDRGSLGGYPHLDDLVFEGVGAGFGPGCIYERLSDIGDDDGVLSGLFRLPGLQLVAYCFARIAERDLFHISFGVFGACYGVGPVLFLLIFGNLFGVVEYVSEQDDADYQEADECLLIHS